MNSSAGQQRPAKRITILKRPQPKQEDDKVNVKSDCNINAAAASSVATDRSIRLEKSVEQNLKGSTSHLENNSAENSSVVKCDVNLKTEIINDTTAASKSESIMCNPVEAAPVQIKQDAEKTVSLHRDKGDTDHGPQSDSVPSKKSSISCSDIKLEIESGNDSSIKPISSEDSVTRTTTENDGVSCKEESKSVNDSNKTEDRSSNGAGGPRRQLPDLPADLAPLKARCTTMSQEVLQLLSQKIKEDIAKTKDAKDVARTQQLRELSWKVTDMLALGSSAVKEFEGKSAYQLQREREAKKFRNKKNRQWQQPQNVELNYNSGNTDDQCWRNNHGRQNNRGNRRGRRGRRDYNDRSNCNSNQNWRSREFNPEKAKRFAQTFIKKIISQSIEQFRAEEEERTKLQMSEQVSLAVDLVDTIINKSIQCLVIENTMVKNNLSLTESELLCDMLDESVSDEETFMMNVENSLSIKKEPKLGC